MSDEEYSTPIVPVAVLFAIPMAARMHAGNGIAATVGVHFLHDPSGHRQTTSTAGQHFGKTQRLRQQQWQQRQSSAASPHSIFKDMVACQQAPAVQPGMRLQEHGSDRRIPPCHALSPCLGGTSVNVA